MFSRQRALLRLVENEGGTISRLRLVKLAFMLSRDQSAPRAGVYDFLPYKHGPFSFTLYHEIRALNRVGCLIETEHQVQISADPGLSKHSLGSRFLSLIDGVSSRCRRVTTSALVDSVYASYPWFTINSADVRKRRGKRPSAYPAVYTVGYQGMMVDGLLDLLLRRGVRQLVDVRFNPVARRYGFHKVTLQRLCNAVDIEYFHFGSLGVPGAWRTCLSDRSSYERLFDRYTNEILPREEPAIDCVACLISGSPSAIMCMEADHQSCHRSRLGEEISRRTSLPVQELRGM